MDIKQDDYKIIMQMESDPLISYTDLASKLNISWPTIKKRIELLKKENILFDPYGHYTPETIGLHKIYILAEIPNLFSLKVVIQSCREHPYTYYRITSLNKNFGIFIHYNIPKGTEEYLTEYFNSLQNMGYIEKYTKLISHGKSVRNSTDLTYYNFDTGSWSFSWNDWLNKIQQMTEIPEFSLKKEEINTDYSEFRKIHFQLLKNLSKNAALKQSELMKIHSLSRTDSSRHYNFVKDNFNFKAQMYYDYSKFQLNHTHMIKIDNFTDAGIKRLKYGFEKFPTPFLLTMDFTSNNSVIIWAKMDRLQAMDFAYAFWEYYPNLTYYTLEVSANGSAVYNFYPENFDFEVKDWKKSREYIVTEPLNRLKEWIKKNKSE